MNNFRNILYVSESTVDQVSAFARAVSLAERNHATLSVIDMLPPLSDGDKAAKALQLRGEALDSLIEPYRPRLEISLEVRMGTVFLETIRAVLQNAHDMVIKAAESPGFLKRLFGSDDMHLLRKCPCPVWLMKTPEKPKYRNIVAAVDLDPLRPAEEQDLNMKILELSSSLALSESASLHIIHAWGAFAEGALLARSESMVDAAATHIEQEYLSRQQQLFGLGERLRQRIGTEAYNRLLPRFHLPKGNPKRIIPATAEELGADLVVMGTVVRTGITGLIIGNTAETILNQLTCSVLAVKPAGFSTPVKLTQ